MASRSLRHGSAVWRTSENVLVKVVDVKARRVAAAEYMEYPVKGANVAGSQSRANKSAASVESDCALSRADITLLRISSRGHPCGTSPPLSRGTDEE